jgi:hypothetical protein
MSEEFFPKTIKKLALSIKTSIFGKVGILLFYLVTKPKITPIYIKLKKSI